MDNAASYQTVLHSQTLAVGETRLLNHSLPFVLSGHLRGSCCPRRAGRGRLHSGHQRAAHGPPQTLGGSTNYQEGPGEHHTDVVRVWPHSSGLTFLVVKYIQNFVKIYKTLVSETMHTCICCVHQHYPSQEKFLHETMSCVKLFDSEPLFFTCVHSIITYSAPSFVCLPKFLSYFQHCMHPNSLVANRFTDVIPPS